MSSPEIPENALFEIRNVRQIRGEARRRWFFSHEMDLIVWFDEEDRPISFQLAYDKHRTERVIRWKPASGYSHYRADDGLTGDEAGPSSAGSLLLIPDGPFNAARVRARFLILSSPVPEPIANYVADRLREHPEYQSGPAKSAARKDGSIQGALGLAVLIAIPLLMVLAFSASRSTRSRQR
jgi:hypothetical protein